MRRRASGRGGWSLASLPDWFVLQTTAADEPVSGAAFMDWLEDARRFRGEMREADVEFDYYEVLAERERRLEVRRSA